MTVRVPLTAIAIACSLLCLPALSAAQTGSAITGVVRDSSGAVLPGVTVEASSPALIERARAVAAPSLGRNFSAGARGTADVALVEPNSMFDHRTNILDLRLSKRLRLGKTSITANVDLSNALNANTPQYLNTQYGPQWLNVTDALSARVVRPRGAGWLLK